MTVSYTHPARHPAEQQLASLGSLRQKNCFPGQSKHAPMDARTRKCRGSSMCKFQKSIYISLPSLLVRLPVHFFLSGSISSQCGCNAGNLAGIFVVTSLRFLLGGLQNWTFWAASWALLCQYRVRQFLVCQFRPSSSCVPPRHLLRLSTYHQ
jgi:hypothetical protein